MEYHRHKVQDPLKKVNLSTGEKLRIIHISSLLKANIKDEIIKFLNSKIIFLGLQ